MNAAKKSYLAMIAWIVGISSIGFISGKFIKNDIYTWYNSLNQSPLTPPNYVFSGVWSILYTMIAISGWNIWRHNTLKNLKEVKILYITQLMLNWMWTPTFFLCHLVGTSFGLIIALIIITTLITYKTYKKLTLSSILLMPYLAWLLFAAYLNFYIWMFN